MFSGAVVLTFCSIGLTVGVVEQRRRTDSDNKDVLLEPANCSALEKLNKRMEELELELQVLKEVQALHYVCLRGIQVPGKCFLANQKKMNFYDAGNDCVTRGGSLCTPQADHENARLQTYARQNIGPRENVWLGINDIVKEGHWVDKAGNDIQFQNWERDITHQPLGGRNRNCAVMSGTADGKWFDENCKAERAFICEFSVV